MILKVCHCFFLSVSAKLMLICAKNEYKQAPNEIIACGNPKNENSTQRSIHNLSVPSMNTFVPSSTAKKFLPKASLGSAILNFTFVFVFVLPKSKML